MPKLLCERILLVIIIAIAFLFRFNNLNWDANYHLHPDERFLTMVGGAVKIPNSIEEYLDPKVSPLNPANAGFQFFVYGVLPITINKIIAVELYNDTYNTLTLQGRALSAILDILTLFLVYQIVKLLEDKYSLPRNLKYWAAFFYGIAVLPIQLAHFFTTDTFLSFFMIASLYCAIRYYLLGRFRWLICCGILFGMAVACKISAFYMLPLQLYFLLLRPIYNMSKDRLIRLKRLIVSIGANMATFLLSFYLSVRLTDPYLFETGNIFDLQLNKLFIANIKSLKAFELPDIWYPPAVQWFHLPPLFALRNMVFFGLGIPLAVLVVLGITKIVISTFSKQPIKSAIERLFFHPLIITLGWSVVFFIYQSTRRFPSMRYFIFLYPILAIMAACGWSWLIQALQSYLYKKKIVFIYFPVILTVLLVILVWPLAFSSIYSQPHSRVQASQWIYQHVPPGSVILTEHWDDGLPLPSAQLEEKSYQFQSLPVFDPDTEAKWQIMSKFFIEGNYYILSSNRGWGSIPIVPERYPLMSRFYADLFADKTDYKKAVEFTSYPSITLFDGLKFFPRSGITLRVTIPDDWAEEAFTVYDHPQVFIFKKT